MQQAKDALAAEKLKVEEAIKFGKPLLSEAAFSTFADEFLNYQERRIASKVAKGKLSKAEYARQKGIVETHLKPFFGKMRLATIRRKDVAAYINSRMGEVGDGTIIKEVNTLKRLFNIAVEGEKILVNPANRAPVPKAPEGRVRYLSAEELSKVLRACPEWLRPIAGLAVVTGMRRGEMLNSVGRCQHPPARNTAAAHQERERASRPHQRSGHAGTHVHGSGHAQVERTTVPRRHARTGDGCFHSCL